MNRLIKLVDEIKAKQISDKLINMKNYEWLLCQAANDLENISFEAYMEKIENNKIGWDHEVFEIYKKKQNEYDEFVSNPFETEEGVVECINCKSKRVYSTSMQMRSADEPMTVIAFCTQCKARWTSNN